MHASSELPQPDADALAHSARVSTLIAERIDAAGGWIDFADYMNLALYAPGLGYYSAGAAKFGAGGDFVTAPEVSDLFARTLARAIEPMLADRPGAVVLELGAGTGALAAGILRTLARDRTLPARYQILEVSADLRERQRRTLGDQAPELLSLVEWLDELPAPIEGVVLANEVLDALPVSRFRMVDDNGHGSVQSLGVAVRDGQFRWAERPAPASIVDSVNAIGAMLGAPLPSGFTAEVNANLPAFIAGVAGAIENGACLLIDYGLPTRELYGAERDTGTLICHYRHRAHDDPFLYPGLQDISAWVDFTAVATAASVAGFSVASYATQAGFLIAAGIEDEFLAAGDDDSPASRASLSGQMQTLLMPGQMGERFKVMCLTRGAVSVPAAVAQADESHRL
ncbi:MAG: class I SAM-dependent methyltransferase [Gammaproteobacteria bacterium]